jgi:hypothetical protein
VLLDWVSTQDALHATSPGEQPAEPGLQAPLSQSSDTAHALPQLPQFLASAWTSAHVPPQSSWAPEQPQAPSMQGTPALQALPQVPQFAASLSVSTQASPH